MKLERTFRIILSCSTSYLICFSLIGDPLSTGLEFLIGQKVWKVDARLYKNRLYYRLNDLTSILNLQLKEKGSQLDVEGPEGRITVVDGRPLLKFKDHYILLSAPFWKMRTGNWYVTEDFISKAIPLVINRKLKKVSQNRYQIDALENVLIKVRVANYPGHVRVVFESRDKTAMRIQERENYIEVEFSQSLVQPEFPDEMPDRRFVSSVDFDTTTYGTFRIHKGYEYYKFLEFKLSDPERAVIDIYGLTRDEEVVKTKDIEISRSEKISPDLPTTPANAVKDHNNSSGTRPSVITIDPGHGGDNYGVNSQENLLEKFLTLEIANQIRSHLGEKGYSVMLTRTRDVNLPIDQRSSVGNYYNSQAFLSIHAGGSLSPDVAGPVVYVHSYSDNNSTSLEKVSRKNLGSSSSLPPLIEARQSRINDVFIPWEKAQKTHLVASRKLARQLQKDLNSLWGTTNQVVEVPMGLLLSINAPAILIETGFLTNQGDYKKLKSPDFQLRLAKTIAVSVSQFLQRRPTLTNRRN